MTSIGAYAFMDCSDLTSVTLPEGFDTVALYDRALSAGVAYVAGSFFYPDGSHRNTMRVNFSFLDASRMEAGVKLLAEVIGQ